MMEPAELPPMRERGSPVSKAWSLSGAKNRERRVFTSVHMSPEEGEAFVHQSARKWDVITANERRWVADRVDDAEWLLVGFGTAGRVAQSAMRAARAEGHKVGVWRPISLAPFPTAELKALAPQLRGCLVVEMNTGQMIEDVRLAFDGRVPVSFFGRCGGVVPVPEEVLEAVHTMVETSKEVVC